MNEDTLLERLTELAPFADRDEARRAFDSTLQAMRRGLNEDEADWLAVALGPSLSGSLLRDVYAGELSIDELYRWTKRYSKTRKSVAVEQVQVVCRALAELLQPPELERLQRHLPQIRPLLEVPPAVDPPSAPRHRRPEPPDHTLAGGRPGSSRPVSEAGPSEHSISSGVPDRAQTHSIARSDDPHADTRLSSTRGFSQEREGRSLARHGTGGR